MGDDSLTSIANWSLDLNFFSNPLCAKQTYVVVELISTTTLFEPEHIFSLVKNFPTSFIFVVLLGTHFMDYCGSTKELSFWIESAHFFWLFVCMLAYLV